MMVNGRWPVLAFRRLVEVPAKVAPDGHVIEPAHPRFRVTWPHFEPVTLRVYSPPSRLEVEGVIAGWLSAESLAAELDALTAETRKMLGKLPVGAKPKCAYCGTRRGFDDGRCRSCGAPEP